MKTQKQLLDEQGRRLKRQIEKLKSVVEIDHEIIKPGIITVIPVQEDVPAFYKVECAEKHMPAELHIMNGEKGG